MGKPRNPGYKPGDNWEQSDLTGNWYRASEMRNRWDGLRVHKSEWEPRHPQDFVRARKERQGVRGPHRPSDQGVELFTSITYLDPVSTIPDGTFANDLEADVYVEDNYVEDGYVSGAE